MKLLPTFVVLGLITFGGALWADQPQRLPPPVMDIPTDTSFDNSIGLNSFGSLDQSIAMQTKPPIEEFPNTFSDTISDKLSLSTLDLRRVDVGIDFLVLETAVGSKDVYGAGLMLRFTSP